LTWSLKKQYANNHQKSKFSPTIRFLQ